MAQMCGRLAVLALACLSPILAAESIKGKVAFITGASSGIGAIVASELAKKGMKVVLTARRKEKLEANVAAIKQAGGEAAAFSCDVSNVESVSEAFNLTEKTYGGIDFVFANAGIEGGLMTKSLLDQDDAKDIQAVFDINVVGAIQTLKHAVKAFEKRGGGTIAFSSSIAGVGTVAAVQALNNAGAPRANGLAYSASKAALDMVAENAHGSYVDLGIKVYNLNIACYASEIGDRLGFKQDEALFNPIKKTSLGNPVHIASALAAILDGSSKWPAGSAFVIDNDITFDSKYLFNARKSPGAIEYFGWPSPEELKPFAMDVKGEPYNIKEEL